MYISIDMDSLTFLHKHPSILAVSDLDFIRCKHEVTSIASLDDYQLFDHFTDKELSTLFLNTTGVTPAFFGTQLRMTLMELAEKFPVTDVDVQEAMKQADFLQHKSEDGVKGYFYAKGAKLPSQAHPVLFPKLMCTSEDGTKAVKRLAVRAAQLAPHASAVAATTDPTADSSAVVRTAARPRSGVCKAIWEALDLDVKMTGLIPPRDRVKELALKNGWHTSTASTQYAAWRKQQSAH